MSLHQLANHMSAQGRGPDSTLVHMSPREVSGLQSLAMANGGTLTINPETGLPEAGFLDSLLPTLLGGAATFFSGGAITPFMAALGVGGLTALTSKDLGKGLMAGLGAYGGAGITEGLAGFGANAIGAEAAALTGSPGNAVADAANKTAQTGASYSDRLSRGLTEGFKNPMGAVKAIGGGSTFKGAAMIGAPLLSALSSQDQTSVPTPEQIKFDPSYANINITREQLPYQRDTGSSAQRGYFGPTYINRNAADGGFVSDGGIEHFAAGGIPLDPDYDYSGYGRKKTDVVRPVTPMPDVPKPDFLAADGKTYRYDPIKRSWYVLKEAEDKKVNAGVETLMGGAGMGGNDGVTGQQGSGGQGQTGYGMLANLAGEAQRAGFTTIGSFLSSAIPENAAYNKTDLDTGLPTKGAFTAADLAALSGKNDKGSSVSLDGTNTGGYEGVTNTGQTGMSTGTTGGSPAQAGDISNPGGPVGGVTADTGFSGFSAPGVDPQGEANGGMVGRYAQGGLGSLGGYSDGGRLLRGPGDGVSDSIPATVGDRQPARLADGEFVVPARIVSELGNGSTEAGARALYKMMDRIQANRRKTTGKNKVAVNSKSHKYLPA